MLEESRFYVQVGLFCKHCPTFRGVRCVGEPIGDSPETNRFRNGRGIMSVHDSSVHIARTTAVLSASALISVVLAAQSFPLDSASALQPHDVTVEALSYEGRKAARVVPGRLCRFRIGHREKR